MTDAALGLREQKRLATRHALQVAMLEQALQRGFENVTIDEVAAAAQVSQRTFFNYFATKEEAVAGQNTAFELQEDQVQRFLDGSADVLADLVDLLARAARDEDGVEVANLRRRLMRQEPQLLGVWMARVQQFHESATDLVAERLRADRMRTGAAEADAAVRSDAGLIVMVGVAIARHGFSRWAAEGGTASISDRIRGAYDEFRSLTAVPAA